MCDRICNRTKWILEIQSLICYELHTLEKIIIFYVFVRTEPTIYVSIFTRNVSSAYFGIR